MSTTHNARHAIHEFDAVARIRDNAGMSVEYGTNRAVAGSTGINNTPGGESHADATLNNPGAAERQDGTARRGRGPGKPRGRFGQTLVIHCERCSHAIVGPGAGFAYVDLRQAQQVLHRIARGYHDPVRAPWQLAHRQCAPEALRALSPYYCVWADALTTVDDLLDAFVVLSRTDWLAGSDWGSLVRRILADAETAAMTRTRVELVAAQPEPEPEPIPTPAPLPASADPKAKAAERRRRRKQRGLTEDDSRHGTTSGYTTYGCRCDPCKAAHATDERERKAARRSEGQP